MAALPQWWLDLTEKEQADYLDQHPASKLGSGTRLRKKDDAPKEAEISEGGEHTASPADSPLPKGGEKFRRVIPKAFANRNFDKVVSTSPGAAAARVIEDSPETQKAIALASSGETGNPLADEDKKKVRGKLHTAMLGLALGIVVLGALSKEQVEPISDLCEDAASWLLDRAGKGPVLDKQGRLVMDAEDTGEDDSPFSDEDIAAAGEFHKRIGSRSVAGQEPQLEVTNRGWHDPEAEDETYDFEDVGADDPTQADQGDASAREKARALEQHRAVSVAAAEVGFTAQANCKWLLTYTVAYMQATATAAVNGSVS